jgi:hypothetical protein
MARGRPPLGPKNGQELDGSAESKRRLQVLLETLAGSCSVPDACRKLGIGAARFHQLRSAILQASIDRLEPRPAGRPAVPSDPQSQRIAHLEHEVLELRIQLHAAQIREEIALAMPHLLHPSTRARPKKTTPPSPQSNPAGRPTGSAAPHRSSDRSCAT